MASLTEASIMSRKFIRYGIYFLIFLISARFLFNTAKSIWLYIFPPPPAKPTVAFGNLPTLLFPFKEFPKDLNISVQTPDGNLPTFPIQLPVYQMPPIPQDIKALDEAKDIAQKLSFDPNGKPSLGATPSVYIFSKKGSPSTLTMNIITKQFSINFNILQNPAIVQGTPPDKDQAIGQTIPYLRAANSLPDDIENGVTTHQFYKYEVTKQIPVSSQSEANVIKVNFFRKNFGKDNNIPSMTAQYPEANIWFTLGLQGIRDAIEGEYYYFPIDEKKSGTYPILTAQQALDKLKAGKAFLVSFKGSGKNVTIRKIYLAYFDARQYQEYYQPIVVFEGDEDFRAYVPAISDDFYGKEEPK